MSIYQPWLIWFRRIFAFFRRKHIRIVLIVNKRCYELHPNRKRDIMVTVNVGHEVDCTIGFLDANGNPMLVTPTPDAAPTWTNAPAPPGAAALTVAADGLSAIDRALAAGGDTLNLALAVGGVQFSTTLAVTISAEPQVLTSIEIIPVVN